MAIFDTFQRTCVAGVAVDELIAIARSATCDLESCLAHKLDNPEAADGVYPIRTHDGHEYQAFCDMTRNGGGWELVLRAQSSDSVFTFDSELWTNDQLLNEDRLKLSTDVDSKFESFLCEFFLNHFLQAFNGVHAQPLVNNVVAAGCVSTLQLPVPTRPPAA